jgi:hypothetical protein
LYSRGRPLTRYPKIIAAREPERPTRDRSADAESKILAQNSAIAEKSARCRSQAQVISAFSNGLLVALQTSVTLKIEKTLGERGTIIKLMGRIRADHLDELKAQISASVPRIVLEVGEVSLVDADAVRFLSTCETEGIELLNCSAYIREWIVRERESAIKG